MTKANTCGSQHDKVCKEDAGVSSHTDSLFCCLAPESSEIKGKPEKMKIKGEQEGNKNKDQEM